MARCRHKFVVFPEALLFFVAVGMSVATSHANNARGFISIDCGSNGPDYNDSRTGLTWVRDGTRNYNRQGMNGVVPMTVDANLDNSQALKSFRYFREDQNQSKHCYELPVTSPATSFLIRAMFLHGGASELALPIEFDAYINANLWFSVQYDSSALNTPMVYEGIFHKPGDLVFFCLVPNRGTPFVSSLEMRPLDPKGAMYNFSNRETLFLSNPLRLNPGAAANASKVRYPDDEYDRLWTSVEPQNDDVYSSTSSTPVSTTSAQQNNVPPKVMADGWNGANAASSSDGITITSSFFFSLNLTFLQAASNTGRYIYAIFYFEALDEYSTGENTTLFLNGALLFPPFNVSQITVKAAEHLVEATNELFFKLASSTESGTNLILNAMEFYEEHIFDPSVTDASDVDFIGYLKTTFFLEDWQGDPCFPVPHSWLSCVPKNSVSPYNYSVSSISLSNLNNSRDLLTLEEYSLTIQSFNKLSITSSYIDDSIFQFFFDNISFMDLQILDFTDNAITRFPLGSSVDRLYDIVALNFSYNQFEGEVPSFVDQPFVFKLQHLNLSHNRMTSLPTDWGNASTGMVALVTLDLSYNNLASDINFLSGLVQLNIETLVYIDVSNNNLSGDFPSSLYISNLTNESVVILDRNNIGGVLDLTAWHDKLQRPLNGSKSPAHWNQVFSFVENDIRDINPSADVLQPAIDAWLKRVNYSYSSFGSTILLGGNPYCKDAISMTQLFLCRQSVDDGIVYEVISKKDSKALIIGASVGGAFFFLLSSVLFAAVWRLWNKVRSLRAIQQELTDRKVQPPLYSFQDLKMATRDFHNDNVLGKGGFGIVYKGILSDNTPIAVKKLFHSEKVQVLNEFLNEVVLITGIKHRNLIQLKGCCIEKERILVYDYAENGNLAEALWGNLQAGESLPWKQRLSICVGIARGLAYLHEELQPRIIHRDIKSPNVLLDRNFDPKIADFGLAKSFLEEESKAYFTQFAGTRGYFAPEYATQGQLTEKADVYSFGILVLEIVSGRKCLDYTLPEDELYVASWAEQLQQEGKVLDLLQPELRGKCPDVEVVKVINIALICVQLDPKFRPSMSQVITMFLGNIDLTEFLNQKRLKQPDFDSMLRSNIFDHFIMEDSGEFPSSSLYEETESPLLPNNISPRIQRNTSFWNKQRSGSSGSTQLMGSTRFIGSSTNDSGQGEGGSLELSHLSGR